MGNKTEMPNLDLDKIKKNMLKIGENEQNLTISGICITNSFKSTRIELKQALNGSDIETIYYKRGMLKGVTYCLYDLGLINCEEFTKFGDQLRKHIEEIK